MVEIKRISYPYTPFYPFLFLNLILLTDAILGNRLRLFILRDNVRRKKAQMEPKIIINLKKELWLFSQSDSNCISFLCTAITIQSRARKSKQFGSMFEVERRKFKKELLKSRATGI